MDKINTAREQLNQWMIYTKLILKNKNEIIGSLEDLSLKSRWYNDLFDYRINTVYQYLENDFNPLISVIKSEIDEWKLSKEKYKLLLESSNYWNIEDIFFELIVPLQKLISEQLLIINNSNFNNKLCDRLDMLKYIIPSINDIIIYWKNQDIEENNENYYFQWYDYNKNEVVKISRDLIYKERFLHWKNGQKIELVGAQNKLCEYIFRENNRNTYAWIYVEEAVYGQINNSKDALKSLIAQINIKCKQIWYEENILSYKDETVIINIDR